MKPLVLHQPTVKTERHLHAHTNTKAVTRRHGSKQPWKLHVVRPWISGDDAHDGTTTTTERFAREDTARRMCKSQLVSGWLALKQRTSNDPAVHHATYSTGHDVSAKHRGKLTRDHRNAMDILWLPFDPRSWTPNDVKIWLHHMTKVHSLVVDTSFFQMNGRGLCLMPLKGFIFRVPDQGKLLYEDFRERLKRCLLAPGNEAKLKMRPVIVSRQGIKAVARSSSVLDVKGRKSPLTYHTL